MYNEIIVYKTIVIVVVTTFNDSKILQNKVEHIYCAN